MMHAIVDLLAIFVFSLFAFVIEKPLNHPLSLHTKWQFTFPRSRTKNRIQILKRYARYGKKISDCSGGVGYNL